jgi:hypothetical protein
VVAVDITQATVLVKVVQELQDKETLAAEQYYQVVAVALVAVALVLLVVFLQVRLLVVTEALEQAHTPLGLLQHPRV